MAFGACLGCELFCFSIIALIVFDYGSNRVISFEQENVHEMVSLILSFIQRGSDKKLRIIAVNQGIFKGTDSAKLKGYLDQISDKQGYDGLNKITYSDMRNNCDNPRAANLFKDILYEINQEWKDNKRRANRDQGCDDWLYHGGKFIMFTVFVYVFLPILLLSKLLQIVYPWIIVGYLSYNGLLFSDKIDVFQLVMLMIYIMLQLFVVFLGVHVMRIHWWLWHIEPGARPWWGRANHAAKATTEMYKYYNDICWYPQVEEIVFRVIGNDIGLIIMDYCRSFQLNETV